MKTINMTFEDKEFKELNNIKKQTGLSWERFVLSLIRQKKE